ncbi:nucleoside triphosphate pyrophosphohydrolase [Acinetobacter sp. MD2(2019)]|uniref:nucleoside triphosphate pyrophosphohydrolase n=1 Tax=Acinetobacter sp. MD2(2019) TaxID=2605273 RepID=UPI002D1F2033|nr:nucleoside triphosphate pyrophosphohydrolase [Acinetobacter sp. MD2(2019)]MEB3754944.1 nucleoside triphosphate pyrophosphohydrolase [Acinetobacter sp. MD2(2019)]
MEQLLALMQELREKCPWDRKQSPQSLTKYAIEEAYEVEDAIRTGHLNEIKNELGDLLLQVVFQSQMYQEQGAFNFNDVVDALMEKLIRRHPHVFDAEHYAQLSSEDVTALWQKIKQQEKQGKVQSILDDVKHGPAIVQAEQIQNVAAQVGFDFSNACDAMTKFDEEWSELQQAIHSQDHAEIEAEFGDCVFSLINVGRKLGLSGEMALLQTNRKFRRRFAYIETQAKAQGKQIQALSLDDMDAFWNQAKQQEQQ